MFTNLLLVPFEIWKQDKTVLWVWIFENYPVGFRFLSQDVVDPLYRKATKFLLHSIL